MQERQTLKARHAEDVTCLSQIADIYGIPEQVTSTEAPARDWALEARHQQTRVAWVDLHAAETGALEIADTR